MKTLDGSLPVSLQFQLYTILLDKIRDGEWQLGDKLPSEREICETYEVSRITVREAVKNLEREGYCYRKQGKGTFVTYPKLEQKLNKFYSFSEEIKKQGLIPSTVMVNFTARPCDQELAGHLEIQPGELVYQIARLRMAGKNLFAYEVSYIPCGLVKGMTREEVQEEGLYNTIRKRSGLVADEAVEEFEAVNCPALEAELLKVRKDSAILKLMRHTRGGGHMIEYCVSMIRGDRYRYKVTLT